MDAEKTEPQRATGHLDKLTSFLRLVKFSVSSSSPAPLPFDFDLTIFLPLLAFALRSIPSGDSNQHILTTRTRPSQ